MRRRGWMVIVLLAAFAGAAGWYTWRRYTAPIPPQIAHEELDPEVAEAIETARRKIYADPYSAQSWGELGNLLRAAQLFTEAVACFAQAERLDPKNPRWPYLQGEALHVSDNHAALAPLQRAVALADAFPRGAWERGVIAPFLRLAEVHLALGNNAEAEKQLQRALELEPDDPTVHYYLGLLALARDDLPDSLAHLKHCEHSPFTQRRACIQLAALYRRMGRIEEADTYSRKADALPRDSNWVDPFLTEVLAVGRPARFQEIDHLEKRGDYRTAVERLTALIQEKPEYRAYVALGIGLYKLGDLDRAEQALRTAITLAPETFAAARELSRVLYLRADRDARTHPERARATFEEAVAWARQALAQRPDHAMSYVILGMALRRLGQRQQALDAFRKAVECNPNLVDAHFYLGETLIEAGQFTEARTSLERVRELSPNDPRLQAALAKWKTH